VKSATSDIVNLTISDVVVFCGGSNDVSNSISKIVLKHILNFIKHSNNTNIILLSVPHRHDLMDSSCVNSEIRTFNRKLMKCMEIVEYTVLEINPNRECFFYLINSIFTICSQ
jgi:YbbR domain-containing protein